MEIGSGERQVATDPASPRPIAPSSPAPVSEAELLKRARETFRFGPDGRLLPAPGVAERPDDGAGTRDATLDAARAWVSHDPVLDECFEVALTFEELPATDPAPGAEPATAEPAGAVAIAPDPPDVAPLASGPVDAPAADPTAVVEPLTAAPVGVDPDGHDLGPPPTPSTEFAANASVLDGIELDDAAGADLDRTAAPHEVEGPGDREVAAPSEVVESDPAADVGADDPPGVPDGYGFAPFDPSAGRRDGFDAGGVTSNGAATNGATSNGSATNGAATNGAATNGAATNGAATNGAATNGAATNGVGSDGAGANGATNGATANGASTNGVTTNGAGVDDGATADGASGNGGAPNGGAALGAPTRGRWIDGVWRVDGGVLPPATDSPEPGTERPADDDPPFPPVPSPRGRPMLEWPEPVAKEGVVPAAPISGLGSVVALASVLGTSPEAEIAFAQTLAAADAPMGVFRWPSGAAQWANEALESWLLPAAPGERTLVALLDEWSQAHFLVRILPELLRLGRWRGQLRLAASDGRTESMLVTLVAHEDELAGTDAVSLFAMPLAPAMPVRVDDPAPAETFASAAIGAAGPAVGPSDQLFRALVQHVSDLIVVTDVHGRITFASPAAQALLDLAPAADGVRPNLLAIMHPDHRPTALAELARQPDDGALPPHPLRVLGADGSWRDLSGVLTDLTAAPAIGGYVLNAQDVTDAVRAEQSITDQAYTDALTGLANRVRLLDRLEGAAHASPPVACALVVLGLDHVRRIEAEHDAHAVEAVLVAVGERLARATSELRGDALAARLHGDEFAVFVPGVADIADAVGVAGQLRLALREPVRIGDETLLVTASMGVATTEVAGVGEAFDEILACADFAMREAKVRGRDRTVAYDARIADRQQFRRGIDQQLRRAIDSDGLRIQFQPIVELASGRIVGAEALLRVRDDDGELLSPGAFVEAAESSGLISRLGAAVLRTTCEQATALDLDPGGFPISVNVSPRQIADPDFARRVLTILDETGLAPRHLSLEITEGAFVGRDDASETNIVRLRDEGVRLGLDEFGGDASLGYLRRFPLDFVKIDRRLIAGLGSNYVDGTIVRATIELAHKLGLLTVAVGVENEEQQHRLEQLGCDRAQGYLFGGAVSTVELSALLRRR